MTDKQLFKLALDALIWTTGIGDFSEGGQAHDGAKKCLFPAITALKERLAQEKALQALHNENERLGLYEDAYAEPVAWGVFEGNLHDMFFTQSEAQEMAKLKGTHAEVRPFYTHPPQRTEQPAQRTWVGLTEQDLDYLCNLAYTGDEEFALAVQAKLMEKNA
jgi:hypothetical protein